MSRCLALTLACLYLNARTHAWAHIAIWKIHNLIASVARLLATTGNLGVKGLCFFELRRQDAFHEKKNGRTGRDVECAD